MTFHTLVSAAELTFGATGASFQWSSVEGRAKGGHALEGGGWNTCKAAFDGVTLFRVNFRTAHRDWCY